MLTELAVVLSLDVSSIALAALLARWTLRRGQAGAEGRRLVNAASRASEAFLWREGKLAGLAAAIAVALVIGAHGTFVLRKSPGATFSLALWTAFATLLGAGLTAAVAYVTTAIGLRATLRAVRAAQASLDQAAVLALRAAGVAALSAEALSTAAVAALLGLHYLLGGGGAVSSPAQASALLERTAIVLPGACLGSVVMAIVLGMGGSTYHVSADVGALGAFGLEPTDPRNPSMVAKLVGDHVGTAVRRAVDACAVTTLASVAAVLLGVAAFRIDPGASGDRAWALVTLPLVLRGVGVLASACGLFTARVREAERAVLALWRGQITAATLVVGGLAGASLWLVGPPLFGWFVAAGTSGVAAGAVVGHAARRHVDRRFRPVQNMLEAARSGTATTVARGLAVGLGGVVLPLVVLGLLLPAAFQLGERSHLAGGGLLGVATALAGFGATNAYVLALGLFGPIVTSAMAIATLEPETSRPEVRRRAALLDDAGFDGGRVSDVFFIVLGGAAALVAGLAIPLVGTEAGIAAFGLSRPAVVASGALGAALVAAFSGRAVEMAARAGRAAIAEVERQLRAFPRDGGVSQVPDGYTPSYRALIDLGSRLAMDGLVPAVLLGLVAPALLGFGLRVLYMSPGLAREGLTSFVVIASAAGLGTALATDGASAALGATHRESRPRGSSSGFEASLAGHRIGTFVGDAAAPAAHLFVKMLAAAALLIAPLLSGS